MRVGDDGVVPDEEAASAADRRFDDHDRRADGCNEITSSDISVPGAGRAATATGAATAGGVETGGRIGSHRLRRQPWRPGARRRQWRRRRARGGPCWQCRWSGPGCDGLVGCVPDRPDRADSDDEHNRQSKKTGAATRLGWPHGMRLTCRERLPLDEAAAAGVHLVRYAAPALRARPAIRWRWYRS